ncbi:hypothetical protein BDW59DRAFT_37762 [Aspergillus cavernicola]|uniref:SET domain-containing protein n=1 Tax=Aspergillus cavernicola TaxID=176166 RepID=A0ABR4IN70_9EURO
MNDSPGEEHLAFTQWAMSNGIKIKGIAPARFPGRRLGMVATRAIEKNEIMLTVPVSLMLTIDSIPSSFVDQFPKRTSIHGILAAFLTHGDPDLLAKLDTWRGVWPDWAEFENSMPVFWPERLRVSNSVSTSPGKDAVGPILLPPSISGLWNTFQKQPVPVKYETRYQNLLAQQEKRLKEAWRHVVSVFPETEWETFAYNWAIINSRSFYYVSPGKDEPEDWNDAIAMVPFADYFNHVDDAACDVTFDGKKYTFKATKRYEKGEEIYMSYGSHSNDFLLVEYGFCLDNNPSDSIYLDDIIFPELTRAEKTELAAHDFFGNYEITSSGPNENTTAVVCIKCMSRKDWPDYAAGRSQRGFDAKLTADMLRDWVQTYLQECTVAIEALMDVSGTISARLTETGAIEPENATKEKLDLILSRWKQIKSLCEAVLKASAN